ncbi:MAG: alpha/beta hydrolase [Proteobacteria bacterium]|nr:alpha/beta hydrolase [Pseudomonadota bacterium]
MLKHLKEIFVVCLVMVAVLFSGCSNYKIYTMAINNTRSVANLSLKKVMISMGEIVYLDNASDNHPRIDQDVIVMVHGFGGNKDNWVLMADEMTKKYRVIALDLPGHGDSASDESISYTIENQAKWLNEFMDKLHIKKAHMIGNSMGGAICVEFTHLYSEKVLSMTLVDSAGLNKTESEYIQLLKKGVNPLVVGNPDEYKKLMDLVMEKKPYMPGSMIAVMTEQKIARKAMDEKIFKDILTDVSQVGDFLSDIHTPTLIIWGDHDRVIHVDNAEEFHQRIKGSQKVILEGVGHIPMVEAPRKTGEAYKEFLSAIQ